MKTELKARTIKMQNKTYTYLYISIPKTIINTINPIKISIFISNFPKITLPIKIWNDGNGYVIIPRLIAEYFNLKVGQVVDYDFEFK